MKKLTDEEIARRLETPAERYEREQEEARQRAMPHGGWSSAGEQREYERRKAEQDRRQDAATAERKRLDAEAEKRREKARKAHVDGLLEPERKRRRAEWVADHPERPPQEFDTRIWPHLRGVLAEDAVKGRAEELYRKASAGVGRL
jgi:hypothetical protein